MKQRAKLTVQGAIELTESQLLKAFRLLVLKQSPDVTDAVTRVIQEEYDLTPSRIERDKELTKVVAFIDSPFDAIGAGAFAKHQPFTRRWKGFYNSAKDIFDELRKKNKHAISFQEFYDRVLQVQDPAGGKRFIKKDEEGKQVKIEEWRVKQYTSPSQLKKTPQMKGIKWDDKKKEFKF